MLGKNTPLKIQGLNPNHKLLLFLETQHYDTKLSLSKFYNGYNFVINPMEMLNDDKTSRFSYLNSYTIYCGLRY